jgi:hypothetical protein
MLEQVFARDLSYHVPMLYLKVRFEICHQDGRSKNQWTSSTRAFRSIGSWTLSQVCPPLHPKASAYATWEQLDTGLLSELENTNSIYAS